MSYFRKPKSLGADNTGETPGIINVITDLFNLPPVLDPPQPAYGTAPPAAPVTTAPAPSSSLLTPKVLILGGAAIAGIYLLTRKK